MGREHRRECGRDRRQLRHVEQPEQRESDQGSHEAARHQHVERHDTYEEADEREPPQGLAADSVRQVPGERNEHHHEQHADDGDDERIVGRQAEPPLEIGRHVAEQSVVHHVESHDQAPHDDQRPPVAREQVAQFGRGGGLPLAVRFDLAEDRRVLHFRAQVHADEPHRPGDEERDAPGPVVHRLLTQQQREPEHQQGSQREASQRAKFEEAAVETAPVVRRVFGHEGRRAAIFAAGRKALDHAQDHQQRRRPEADRIVRRDQPDADGRGGHEDDREGEDGLAAVAIPERTPEQAAERSDKERDREGRQREQRCFRSVTGEEGGRKVNHAIGVYPIVKPFGGVAHGRRGDSPVEHGLRNRFGVAQRDIRADQCVF